MQHIVVSELSLVQQGIAALCYEKIRLQTLQQQFRHCKRDARHEAWEKDLKSIEERRKELLERQKTFYSVISKQSKNTL